jgi:hypothetical protein
VPGTEQLTKQEDRELVGEVVGAYNSAKDLHEQCRRKWNRFYARYRSYKDFKSSYRQASNRRDVDDIIRDAQRTFGTYLFIPITFSTIETILPRMVANSPVLKVKPEEPQWEDNVDPLKLMVEDCQERIGYPLILQDVAKSGLTYGLGVQKVFHDRRVRSGKPVLERATVPTSDGAQWIKGTMEDHVIYDGPSAECVDVFDWIWSPRAYDVKTLTWAIHRTWVTERDIRERLDSNDWELPAGVELDELLSGSGDTAHDDVWQDRMAAAGYTQTDKRAGHVHECWEFHDGARVITILDKTMPVQAGPFPYWHGDIPFQVSRPTNVLHEMVGIGEAEAIEDLQDEINESRTQRRDNAQLVVQRPFAYFDGLLDQGDIAFGPGIGIPVDGDPREVIFPIPLQDLPESAYRETSEFMGDVERVVGIDDTVSGSSGDSAGAAGTATGVQLVQAAAGIRIAAKTKRLIAEVGKPTGYQFVEILQQKVTEPRTVVGPPKPEEMDREYSYYQVGPEQLAGRFKIDVEPDSTTPDNPVKDADDATRLFEMFGQDPLIDPVKLREQVLKKLGFANPTSLLRPQEPQIPAHVLEMAMEAFAQENGIDPDAFRADFGQLVQGAMMSEQDQQQGGPPDQQGGQPPAQGPPPPA